MEILEKKNERRRRRDRLDEALPGRERLVAIRCLAFPQPYEWSETRFQPGGVVHRADDLA